MSLFLLLKNEYKYLGRQGRVTPIKPFFLGLIVLFNKNLMKMYPLLIQDIFFLQYINTNTNTGFLQLVSNYLTLLFPFYHLTSGCHRHEANLPAVFTSRQHDHRPAQVPPRDRTRNLAADNATEPDPALLLAVRAHIQHHAHPGPGDGQGGALRHGASRSRVQ